MEEMDNQSIISSIISRENDIYNSEESSHFTIPIKLDGNNYSVWKKHFEMAVSERAKLEFLLGEVRT